MKIELDVYHYFFAVYENVISLNFSEFYVSCASFSLLKR